MKIEHVCVASFLLCSVFCAQAQCATTDHFKEAVSTYLADDYEKALSKFQTLKKSDPENARVHYYLALCQLRLGQREKAVEEYEWVIQHTNDPALKEIVQGRLLKIRPDLATDLKFQPTNSVSKAPGAVREVIFFSTNWCPSCKSFASTWTDAERRFKGKVKFSHLNAEDAANWKEVARYRPRAYPTIVYLDGKGNVIENGPGAPGGLTFQEHIKTLGAER